LTQAHTLSSLSEIITTLQSWAHSVIPAGTAAFEGVAVFSLAGYLLFAVTAMNYALESWAGKAMAIGICAATAATLLLKLSLLHSPAYVGEGALWKFVSLSQYLPGAVIGLGCAYLLYRIGSALRKSRS